MANERNDIHDGAGKSRPASREERGEDSPRGPSVAGPTLVWIGLALLGTSLVLVGFTAAGMISAFNRIAALDGAARPADLAEGVPVVLVRGARGGGRNSPRHHRRRRWLTREALTVSACSGRAGTE